MSWQITVVKAQKDESGTHLESAHLPSVSAPVFGIDRKGVWKGVLNQVFITPTHHHSNKFASYYFFCSEVEYRLLNLFLWP